MRATVFVLWLTACAFGSPTTVETYGDCPAIDGLSSVVIDGAEQVDLGVFWAQGLGIVTLDSQAELDAWYESQESDPDVEAPVIDWQGSVLVISTVSGGGCSGPTVEWMVVQSGDGAHVEVGVTHPDALCRSTCDMAWSSVTAITVPRTTGGATACLRYRKTCE